MEIQPIGKISTCFDEKFATPRQPGLCPSAWGILEFTEEYRSAEAVRGLEGFSHLWLIFGFHKTQKQGWHPTVRPPRLGGNERVGVFASRSTFRPNGLGLSLVALDRISFAEEERLKPPLLYFTGVDLIDGTPIYDIKPYLPYAEAFPMARAGYAVKPIERIPVKISDKAEPIFLSLSLSTQQIICEALSLDPRPATTDKNSEKSFGALICGYNVSFQILDKICWIRQIEKNHSNHS